MSRIGKKLIQVPDSVKIDFNDQVATITGPMGTLSQALPTGLNLTVENGVAAVTRADDTAFLRAQHGLMRTLVSNMIVGVTTGNSKQLEIQGVGYRAVLQGSDLVLSLGYSHPINVKAPDGITFTVEKNIITVKGIDKALVGEVAAKIRDHRKPEPYKGKGIRYVGEVVRRKAGKAAKA